MSCQYVRIYMLLFNQPWKPFTTKFSCLKLVLYLIFYALLWMQPSSEANEHLLCLNIYIWWVHYLLIFWHKSSSGFWFVFTLKYLQLCIGLVVASQTFLPCAKPIHHTSQCACHKFSVFSFSGILSYYLYSVQHFQQLLNEPNCINLDIKTRGRLW